MRPRRNNPREHDDPVCSGSADERGRLLREMIDGEAAAADFGDARLVKRFAKTVKTIARKPGASIPEAAADDSEMKAIYRFFSNESVTPGRILAGHRNETVSRCRIEKLVLAVTDGSSANYGDTGHVEGLGPIGTSKNQGLVMQPVLAATPDGEVLGLWALDAWARDPEGFGKRATRCKRLPTEEKESGKWLRAHEHSAELAENLRESGSKARVLMVADSEADMYPLLAVAEAGRRDLDILVRGYHDRRLSDGETKLWEAVGRKRPERMVVEVPARPGRPGRTATLEVRRRRVRLKRPPQPAAEREWPKTVEVWAVEAVEIDPKSGRRKKQRKKKNRLDEDSPNESVIQWRLLTTLDLSRPGAAQECVRLYSRRWLIEQLFRCMKTNCGAETRQLKNAARLKKSLTLDAMIAAMLMRLLTGLRKDPQRPATELFTDRQWRLIWTCATKEPPPERPPTVADIARCLGKIGRHIRRSADDDHFGMKVLQRALVKVADFAEGFETSERLRRRRKRKRKR